MTPKVFALIVVSLLIIIIFVPVASAANVEPNNPRSGKTETIITEATINPDDTFNYTEKFNVADASNQQFLNFNYTIVPFLENNTDIRGIVVAPYFLPFTMNGTVSDEHISVANLFRVPPNDIISGGSEAWIRIPILDIPDEAEIRLRIARVLDPTSFNASIGVGGIVTFDKPENIRLICDITDNTTNPTYGAVALDFPNTWQDQRRQISIEFNNTGKYFNHTYFKADAGLFANEWYFIMFDIVYPSEDNNVKLSIAMDDLGADNNLKSWTYLDKSQFIPADLDMSMIFTKGMSNGITGIGVNESLEMIKATSNFIRWNITIPMNIEIEEDYLQVLIPLLIIDPDSGIPISIRVQMYDESGLMFFNQVRAHYANTTYDYIIKYFDVSAYDGDFVDHLSIIISSDDLNATNIRMWGVQMEAPTWTDTFGHTDIYFQGTYAPSSEEYIPVERTNFIPYGFYGFSSSYWNMTEGNITLIAMNTPESPQGIVQAINNVGIEYFHFTPGDLGDGALWIIGKGVEIWWQITSFYIDIAIQVFLKIHPVGIFISDIIIPFIEWVQDQLGMDIWSAFLAFANWFKGAITFVVDALEWFGYWAVRFIYSISMLMVYMINVFGVISINAALLAYSKTGNSRDFINEFRSGWKFVFAIISFMISLLIMAISIVGAVLPF